MKMYKRKKRACAMCKPHKAGWEKKWTAKDLARLKAGLEAVRQEVESWPSRLRTF